jgi:hypothetical protein
MKRVNYLNILNAQRAPRRGTGGQPMVGCGKEQSRRMSDRIVLRTMRSQVR